MFLFSDKAPQFQNTAARRRSGSKFWPKFGPFCPPCKKGGQHGSNVCGYFRSGCEGRTVGIVLAGVRWATLIYKFGQKKRKYSSKIYRPPRTGPGGLNYCWYRIDGRLLGRFSSISSGVKKFFLKLENVAIARHCNLRPPGLPPDPPPGAP